MVLLSLMMAGAVVLSVLAGTFLLRQPREGVEILVQDVAMLPNVPEDGMTELHFFLVVRNPTSSSRYIETIVLVARHPDDGTLFDTYTHQEVRVSASQNLQISEVSAIDGLYSEVSFRVKILNPGVPAWESPLTPDAPVSWYPG